MKQKIIKYFPLIIVLLFAIFVSRHLLLPGFVPTHDGEYHIIRFWQFDKVIRSGNLFPLWAPDLDFGKGVPIFAYFYPLSNYISEIFVLLGFSYVKSLHLVLASGLVFSALSFYLWIKALFGRWAGLVGAVFYTLAPYHLVDVFVRGSVGEVWALALAPLCLFFTTKIVTNRKYVVLNSIFLYLLLLSHNIIGPVFFVFCLVYGLLFLHKAKKTKPTPGVGFLLLLSYFLGFILSLYFWLPVILDRSYVTGLETVNIIDHFPEIYKLIFPSWGTGFSGRGYSADQMSFQIGIAHILAFVAVILLLIKKKLKSSLVKYMLISFLISVWLILDVSSFIWQKITWMSYFQFPWRLLSVVIVTTSFMAGYVSRRSRIISVVLIIMAVLLYLPYTRPVVYEPRDDLFYLSNPTWTQGTATTGNVFRAKSESKDEINNSLARKSGSLISIIGLLTLIVAKVRNDEI